MITLIRDIIRKNKRLIFNALGYILPVFAGVGIFYLQASSNTGWLDQLLFKFSVRSAMNEDDPGGLINSLIWNFESAFNMGNGIIFMITFFGALLIIMLTGIYLVKEKKLGALFERAEYSLPLGVFSGVALQLFVLKNHSAVHEFAFIKFSAFIILTVPMLAVLMRNYMFTKQDRTKVFVISSAVFTAILLFMTGVPVYTAKYISDRSYPVEYKYEEKIGENTDYYDVVFTDISELAIENTPPMPYLYAKKLIYYVDDVQKIFTMFPDLSDEAKILFVTRAGNELPDGIEAAGIRYEDNEIMITEIVR